MWLNSRLCARVTCFADRVRSFVLTAHAWACSQVEQAAQPGHGTAPLAFEHVYAQSYLTQFRCAIYKRNCLRRRMQLAVDCSNLPCMSEEPPQSGLHTVNWPHTVCPACEQSLLDQVHIM